MIDVKAYGNFLMQHFAFFSGVPDSSLSNLCAYLSDQVKASQHIIAANEGNALALAAGHYLATKQPAVVYMQNSGLGNIINPLLSLNDPAVFGIPALLFIGWRGEPGTKDEPQHKKQGIVTLPLLEASGIRYAIHPDNLEDAKQMIEDAKQYMLTEQAPFAIVLPKGLFSDYKLPPTPANVQLPRREEAIGAVLDCLDDRTVIVCTTGMPSRELFELRKKRGQQHDADFLTVGCMGHASQIALGIAIEKPDKEVICLDGDGAILMHMGAMAIIGTVACPNFIHIVLNNAAHDSVGGQPTVAAQIDIINIAKACGYVVAKRVDNLSDMKTALLSQRNQPRKGAILLEVMLQKGARDDLGRPTSDPQQNKTAFMKVLSNDTTSHIRSSYS